MMNMKILVVIALVGAVVGVALGLVFTEPPRVDYIVNHGSL